MPGTPSRFPQIRPVSFVEDVLIGAASLVRAHYREVCLRRDLFDLEPDLRRYRELEHAKALITFGAFVGDELVGYAASIVMPHPHYASAIVCHNDVIYVAEPHRNTSIGARLMRLTEDAAKKAGCRVCTWHAKKDSRFANVLDGHGYWVQDIVFAKEL